MYILSIYKAVCLTDIILCLDFTRNRARLDPDLFGVE